MRQRSPQAASKVDGSAEGVQRIAEITQTLQVIIEIEEPGCVAHRIASKPSKTIDSEDDQFHPVFGTAQLPCLLIAAALGRAT
ncbi:MAG: hypothetical protein P4L98_04800 [Ancalomicrobiaceae bacterium]|nr:hypothetical protein [Ancalomicrobiaceae bacterium]